MRTNKRMTVLAGLAVWAAFFGSHARAASGMWTGAADACWTNAQNWAAVPYPGTNDTAFLAGAGGGRTNIAVTGLPGVKSITFDGSGAAPYTLGDGSAGGQAVPLQSGGSIRLSDSVCAEQRILAALKIGVDTNSASYTVQNDSPQAVLMIAGPILGSASGLAETYKTLTFSGVGHTVVAGNITKGTALSLSVAANGAGVLSLAGTNTISSLSTSGSVCGRIDVTGQTSFTSGGGVNLIAYQDCVIGGSGSLVLSTGGGENYSDNSAAAGKTLTINCRLTGSSGFEYWTTGNTGTILLNGANDFAGSVIINSPGTVGTTRIGNKGSADSGFGAGTFFRFNADGARLLYLGSGETTDRVLQIYTNAVIDQSGSGTVCFSAPVTVSSGAKTLTLQGSSDGVGEFSGLLQNGSGTLAVTKTGTGAWLLSTNNAYTGATTVSGGALVLTNASGALASTSAIALSGGGTLLLANAAAANNADRLNNAATVTLNGGTLALADDGASGFSETVGAVTVSRGANTIAAGASSTLTITALTRTSGTVDFVGDGLGAGGGCRIFIPGQADGLIGTWAFYNGTRLAAYDNTLGVIPAPDGAYTDIAARGPDSAITNAPEGTVRISSDGTEGPIAVSDTATTINALFQTTSTAATLDTAGKTLGIGTLRIAPDKASVTVGSAAGDGYLTSATAGGALALANDSTNGTLVVNAAITNNGASTSIIKLGTGAVVLGGACAYTGPTFVASGTLTFSNGASQTVTGSISGPGGLDKIGAGTLTLTATNSHTGATRIRSGTVVAQNNMAFGSSVTGTVIESGASLDLGGSLTADTLNLGTEAFEVSGSGVAGLGAIVNTSLKQQANALSRLTLAGDTTFGGTGRWDMRNNLPTLAMNGFTITKTGTNDVGLVAVAVTPGTGNIDVVHGTFRIESGTLLNGNSDNTLTVRSGSTFNLYTLTAAPVWTLALEGGSTVNSMSGVTPQNTWAGPVTLSGTVSLTAASGASLSLGGPISGGGSIVKSGAGSTAYLTGDNNTYAGATIVSNGTLFAANAGSLPGYDSAGRLSVVGGTALALRTGDGTTGWSAPQLDAVRTGGAFAINTAILALDTTLGDFTYGSNLGDPLALTKQGNNVLSLSGVNTYSGVTRITGGSQSALTFASASSNTVGGNIYVNGGSSGAALNVDGFVGLSNSSDLYVGISGGDRSMVNITGTFALDDFQIGWVSGAAGAVCQSAGTMTSRVLSPGATGGGYGYYRLSGGKATVTGYLEVGTFGTGVMDVFAGTLGANNCFDIDRRQGGMGVLTISGGTITSPSNGNPIQIGRSDANAVNGQINIMGSGVVNAAYASTTAILDLNASTNPATARGVVNLLGGSLTANRVSSTRAGTTLFNFGGGTLRVSPGTTLASTFLSGLAAANVYPGGAVIDTTNLSVTVAQSLLAPVGYGVSALTLTRGGAGYIGAPAVVISGGSGTGATAIASVDLDASSAGFGQVTGLTVTCPGFGYQAGDTLTVSLNGGGYTTQAAATAALGANVSGGLTKLGPGILILAGTNTYAGTTTVSNGTLRLGHAAVLPANAPITVAGGTYDLNSFLVTNGAVSVSGGSVVNGTLSGTAFDLGGAATLYASLSGNAAMTISGGGTTTVYTTQSYTGATVIDGTLNLLPKTAGLYEGAVTGSSNTTSNNPCTSIQLTTRYANTTAWSSTFITYIYSGYIWNQANTNVNWTFAENFDDFVLLKIDGNTVLNNGSWSTPTYATYALTPGSHVFEARFGQGDGGVGPVNGSWWNTGAFGFGVDYYGRNDTNIANFVALTDPGDGSLLTLEDFGAVHTNILSAETAVTLTPGSLLNLGGNVQTVTGLSGSGMVSNGTLTVNGDITPGGVGTTGELSLKANVTLGGTLYVDVSATDNACDRVAVEGALTLSSLSLVIANPAQLDRSRVYTLITCTGGRTGSFDSITVPDARWHVMEAADGSVKLMFVDGTLIRVR